MYISVLCRLRKIVCRCPVVFIIPKSISHLTQLVGQVADMVHGSTQGLGLPMLTWETRIGRV